MIRSFLFLQGVASPFFAELGKALDQAGHRVLRINYCGGDFLSGQFFTVPIDYINYRGRLHELADFYQRVFDQHGITDLILFGDTRPVHAAALALAQQRQLTVHVYEEGYFRPNWVTLDQGGVNAHSSLPRQTQTFESADAKPIPTPAATGGGLAIRAWHDIRYHALNLLFKFYFPHYQSHRPVRALKEYGGWIKRMPSLYFYYNGKAEQQIKQLLQSNQAFYLLPLQLDADSQMRIHSPIKTVSELIKTVIQSFAQHAPDKAQLVIKVHPLDPWFINYAELIETTARRYQISPQRIIHLESGDLNLLLKHAQGTVLVNSTVGTSALSLACPVIALGTAIYNLAGLTFQAEKNTDQSKALDQFWSQASPPDAALFEQFKRYVIQHTQINGGFYNRQGIKMAVKNSLPTLLKNAIPRA